MTQEFIDILVGARLKELYESYMVVEKGGKILKLDFITDNGDCCGYAEVKATLLTEIDSEAPVITNVLVDEVDDDGLDCYVSVKIVLFGVSKALATILAVAGSGSGWQYGACVMCECRPNISEVLVEW